MASGWASKKAISITAKNVTGTKGFGTQRPMGQRADTIKPWTKLGEKKWKIKANHVGRLWPFSSGAIGLNNIGS